MTVLVAKGALLSFERAKAVRPLFEISTLLCESRGQNRRHWAALWPAIFPLEGVSAVNGVWRMLSERKAVSGQNYVRTECFAGFATVDLLSSSVDPEV
jgi:hypothetical protein